MLVAIVVSDLLFLARIRDAVVALGLTPRVAGDPPSLDEALARGPALVVVDLHIDSVDPMATITAAKAAGARVLAFGRHTAPATLRAARAAGADASVPRSRLVEELPQLLASLTATRP